MPDSRFYETLAPASLRELAVLCGAAPPAEPLAHRTVNTVSVLAEAGPTSIAFCNAERHKAALSATRAGACFVSEPLAPLAPEACVALVTPLPQAAWAVACDRLHRLRSEADGEGDFDCEDEVRIAPSASIGAGAAIGRGTVIGPGARIGPGVAIGRNCRIGANAVVMCAFLGDGVKILAGAVIGEAGFGATASRAGVIDVPQLGRVILQDRVTVGANTCIDRGAFDDTVVGENTKIDNLVQIAHNVVIGRNCVIAAHTGISGSVTIGDGCQLGGRVGIADHINIGAGARLAAAAGVMRDVPAGESWGGFPARPVLKWMRETAWLARAAERRPAHRDGQ